MHASHGQPIPVVELEKVAEQRGLEGLPYPLGRTRPVGSAWLLGLNEFPVSARLSRDALGAAERWTDAYLGADVWVTCRVTRTRDEMLDTRLLAVRAGESAFLATQHRDVDGIDVVDIELLSPDDLGSAIADASELTRPGSSDEVVIPSRRGRFRDGSTDEDDEMEIQIADSRGRSPRVLGDADIAAIGVIESRCEREVASTVDLGRNSVSWVHVDDDGDYILAPDSSQAVPMTAKSLQDRINRLIAADVFLVQRRRRQHH